MRRQKIIIFGGDVGAGKSTHAKLLTWYLTTRYGIKAEYVHIKGFHIISRYLLKTLLVIRYWNLSVLKLCKWYSPIRILYMYDPILLTRVFGLVSWLNAVDLFLIVLLRQYVKSVFNKVLVIEDHIVGYLNDMVFFLQSLDRKAFGLWGHVAWILGLKLLLKTLQEPRILILFLHAPYDELIKRWRKRGTPEEYLSYLAAGRFAGKLIARLGLNIKYINTCTSITGTFRKISRVAVKWILESW
jgi:deoxyadenosine/deoxycytidine kinase